MGLQPGQPIRVDPDESLAVSLGQEAPYYVFHGYGRLRTQDFQSHDGLPHAVLAVREWEPSRGVEQGLESTAF
jgi:hypothetical protein